VPGVLDASVNLATDSASVETDGSVGAAALVEALRRAGYATAIDELALSVLGMSCASCVGRIEKALSRVPGVLEASVNLATETAHLRVLAGAPIETLLAAVRQAGYRAELPTGAHAPEAASAASVAPDADEPAKHVTDASTVAPHGRTAPSTSRSQAAERERRHLLLAALLSLPLVLPMLGMPFGQHWDLPGGWQLDLATPVQFWLGARFHRAGWGALRAGTGNMDLLVALGTSAGYGLSVYHLLFTRPHHGEPPL